MNTHFTISTMLALPPALIARMCSGLAQSALYGLALP
jgi:hypothetical protein